MPEAGHVKEHMASLLNLGYDSTLYISYPQPLSLSEGCSWNVHLKKKPLIYCILQYLLLDFFLHILYVSKSADVWWKSTGTMLHKHYQWYN